MDPQTVWTVAAFISLTCADQVMTGVWAWRLGPNRARKLIMGDPLFVKLDATLAANCEQLASAKTDLLAVRHDMEAMQSRLTNAISTLERDLQQSLKTMPQAQVSMQIPLSMQDELTRSLRASLRTEMRSMLDKDMVAMLAEAMQLAVQQGGTPLTDEQARAAIEAAEMEAYADAWGDQLGIPRPIIMAAKSMGRAGIRMLQERYPEMVAEAVPYATR